MKLGEIYNLAIEMGISSDPRGKIGVKKVLDKRKKEFKELPEKKKKFFDKENLTNPYTDSRVLYGDLNREIKRVLVGIDADGAEVLLADRLSEKARSAGSEQGIDLVISHHPSGHALASLDEVMDVQVDMYAQAGVPENIAHALFEDRKGRVRRGVGPLNHTQAVDTARLLDMPIMTIHTIWDNLGNEFMNKNIEAKKFDSLSEVLDAINEIPEFTESIIGKCPPAIVAGSPSSRTGKVLVSFTGGTNPSKELYMELAKAGIGTVVEMHVPEDAVQELKKLHVNVIDCGHMAADSIGANLFLDEIQKRGVEIVPCSGLIRVSRVKKK